MAEQISITEAARLLGTSRPTLSKLLSDHDFPRVRSGGKTLVSVREVQDFYRAVKNPEDGMGMPRPPLATEHLSQLQARCAQLEDRCVQLQDQCDQLHNLSDQLQGRCDQLSDQLDDQRAQLSRLDRERGTSAPASWSQVLVRLFSRWG